MPILLLPGDERSAWRWSVIWIGLCTLARLALSAAFPLVPDEANYWQWGRHLAWGYHDQAPLIGWAIGGVTRLGGDREWVVRLPSVVALAVASLYLAAFARRWFGARIAWAVTVLTQGILLLNLGGVLATADGLQAATWAGAVYHTARAYEEHTWRQWLAAGAWLGLGLLAKFSVVLFGFCALGYALWSDRHRPRLASLKPYAALALAIALFAPVLWWNAAHGWSSARHVAGLAGVHQTAWLQPIHAVEFLGVTAALLSPGVFAGLVACLVVLWSRRRETRSWPLVFCLWMSLPVVLFFLVMSLRTEVYGNWPGPGYLTLAVVAAVMLAPSPRLWKWIVGTAYGWTLVAFGLVWLQTTPYALPIPSKKDRVASELLGWQEIGAKAHAMRATLPDPANSFLFATRYQLASQLAFYTPGRPRTVCITRWGRPNVYDYWWTDADLLGKDAIGVTGSSNAHLTTFLEVFERVEPPEAVPIYRRSTEIGQTPPIKTVYFYRCYRFQGGLRPAPKPGAP